MSQNEVKKEPENTFVATETEYEYLNQMKELNATLHVKEEYLTMDHLKEESVSVENTELKKEFYSDVCSEAEDGLYEVKQEMDIGEESVQQKIKVKRGRPMRTAKAWKFFTDLKFRKAKCNYCDKIISYRRCGSGNLTVHLKSWHPEEFSKGIIQPPSALFTEIRTLPSPATPVIDSNSVPKSKKRSFKPTCNIKIQAASLIPPNIMQPNQVSTNTHLPENDPEYLTEKTEAINRKLLKLFAKQYLPFSLVESLEFKEFIEEINPDYKLPSKKIMSNMVNKYYDTTKEKVKADLAVAEHVALSTDGWYSDTKELYINVTAHFFSPEADLKEYSLECSSCECYGNYTAEYLADKIRKICDEWEISDKIVAVTTFNVYNIAPAVRLNHWRQVTCFANSLNFVVQNSLVKINYIHQKVNLAVEFFKRSPSACEKLKKRQQRFDEPVQNLKQDVDSRWHSTYAMFKRLLEMRISIRKTLAEDYLDDGNVIHLLTLDIAAIEKIMEVMGFFKVVTEEMCSGRTVTIAEIIYITNALKQRCTEHLSSTRHGLLRGFILRLQKELERFSTQDDLMLESMLLDPRFKNDFSDEVIRERACVALKTSTSQISVSSEFSDGVLKWCIRRKTEDFEMSDVASTFENEIEDYLKEPSLPKNENPMKWWLCKMYNLACQRLCIPATSVPPEQVFLKSGQNLIERRDRLSGKKVKRLVFLNKNL